MCDLLKIDNDTRESIRKKFEVTQADVEQNISAIREWLVKTPHLPVEKSNIWLENFMIRRRMSVEQTKKALESYYTAKTQLNSYFENLIPYSMAYQKAKSYTCVIAMPVMLKDYGRITIHKLSHMDSELYDPLEAFTIMSMINEIRFTMDCTYFDVIIIDLCGYSLKHIIKFTPKIIKKIRYFVAKTFNFHIHSIHLVNVPQYADKVLPILRSIMSGHIYKKVYVHTTLDTLYQFIPKPYLPSDYGGDQTSIIELFAKWCDLIEKNNTLFTNSVSLKSIEEKRIGRCHEFEIFGTGSDGSFKQLNVSL